MTRKIRYKRLIILFVILAFIFLICFKLFTLRITNIFIDGNLYLSDQDIIESANLSNYPRAIFTFSNSIKSDIVKNKFVKSVDVHKKGLTRVYISVVENKPLLFDQVSNKTILSDGTSVDEKFNVPVLVNNIDSSIYEAFLEQFSLIDVDVFNSISEVEYTPNSVDDKLFLFSMNDGNYISVNLDKFSSVNKYFDMVVNFNNHRGILYLDSGEYFKILEN